MEDNRRINEDKFIFKLIAVDIPVSVIAKSFNEAKEILKTKLLLPDNKLRKIGLEEIIVLVPHQVAMVK